MQSSTTTGAEDPLVAALPPATDYLTYLTLLEYQLTAENLPTLNNLLLADDGTLAAEIGWDLLQLVLPILRVQPQPADECLQIIARRGNPREVIVRLAEELERLAQDGYDHENEETDAPHGLPTFAGEAPPVHLGEMKLDGLSDDEEDEPTDHGEDADEESVPVNAEFDNLKFLSLVNLLPILQSRIKTQHPSRFLATSLPAVLGAFRRMGAKPIAADAILEALKNLSGKQRPALPPRVSTTGAAVNRSGVPAKGVTQVSEPDPEAKASESITAKHPAAGEKAIIERLLQAVLLEVLEDFSTTFPELLFSLQTRSKLDRESLPSYRIEDLGTRLAEPAVVIRSKLLSKFVRVAMDLSIDVDTEVRRLAQQDTPLEPDEQPEDDYPTSPSQIPFSKVGLINLIALSQAANSIPSAPTNSENLTSSEKLSMITHTANSYPLLLTSPSTTDATLSILCNTLFTSPNISALSSDLLHQTYTLLTTIYTTSPHPTLRDSAAHLQTHLFHTIIPSPLKTTILRETLSEATSPSNLVPPSARPPRELTVGNTKAIAVNLLKDSIFPSPSVRTLQTHNPGLTVHALEDLSGELFPDIPAAPETLDDEAKTRYETRDGQYVNVVGEVISHVPFYIAVLNLVDVLGRHDLISDESHDAKTEGVLGRMMDNARAFQRGLEKWKTLFAKVIESEEQGVSVGVSSVSAGDVFALEDALERVVRWVGGEYD